MNKIKFEKGYKKRKKVLGTKYVNQAMKDKNLFNEDFQDFITINCWFVRFLYKQAMGYR